MNPLGAENPLTVIAAPLQSEHCLRDSCCHKFPANGYEVPCENAVLYDAGPSICKGSDQFITADFI